LGDKKSGKSSLVAKLLNEPVKEEMAETTALDFRFGTKQREDKTVQMNIYELGGGRVLAGLLQSVFVGNGIDNAAIIICLDLSKPGNSIETLLYWL
jgi:GTPase SAR1 family protein